MEPITEYRKPMPMHYTTYSVLSTSALSTSSQVFSIMYDKTVEEGTTLKFEESFPFTFYEKEISDLKLKIDILQEQVQELIEQQKKSIVYEFNKIPNEQAKKIIINYLKQIKKDIPTITIFEISQRLRLPADQVEEILEELSKEKRVSFKNGSEY